MRRILYSINPTLKLFMLLLSFIFILCVNDIGLILNVVIVLIVVYFYSTQLTLKQNGLLLIFLFLLFFSTATSMILFGKGNTVWFHFGLIQVTKESFHEGVFLGLRTLVFAFLGILFSLTTKPVSLFYSLMQQLRLKPIYAYSFMASIRLLPLIAEEFQIIQKAIYVRGIDNRWGIGGIFQKLKQYAVPLLAQSIRRAYRIALAMEAKRFSNAKRTYYYQIQFTKLDYIFVCLFLIFALLTLR